MMAYERSNLLILLLKLEILAALTTSFESLFHTDMILTEKKRVRAFILEMGTFNLRELQRVFVTLVNVMRSFNGIYNACFENCKLTILYLWMFRKNLFPMQILETNTTFLGDRPNVIEYYYKARDGASLTFGPALHAAELR